MKTTALLIALGALLSTSSCQTSSESRIERWADRFEDRMEEFEDAMEDWADSIEDNREGSVIYSTTSGNGREKIKIDKNDRYIRRSFDIEAFSGIQVNHNFKVVMCDTVENVVISINEKLNKYLNVRLSKGTLIVNLDNIRSVHYEGNVRCGYVYLPYNLKLRSISLSGSSSFQTALPIKTPNFNIRMSGATNCLLKKGVTCNDLDIDMSGSSDCKGLFSSREISVDMSGATSFSGTLKGDEADLDLSGSSDLKATITATKVEADLSGASNMKLDGTATSMEISLSGSSELDASRLTTETVTGDMSGVTEASLNASKSIAVDLTGQSSMTYRGSADASRCSKSHMSSIKKL